jgi:hypothetical protein
VSAHETSGSDLLFPKLDGGGTGAAAKTNRVFRDVLEEGPIGVARFAHAVEPVLLAQLLAPLFQWLARPHWSVILGHFFSWLQGAYCPYYYDASRRVVAQDTGVARVVEQSKSWVNGAANKYRFQL